MTDGVPSVDIDGTAGLVQLVKHLVEVHAARNIAMIGGPPASADSEARIECVLATLAEFDTRIQGIAASGCWLNSGASVCGVVVSADSCVLSKTS